EQRGVTGGQQDKNSCNMNSEPSRTQGQTEPPPLKRRANQLQRNIVREKWPKVKFSRSTFLTDRLSKLSAADAQYITLVRRRLASQCRRRVSNDNLNPWHPTRNSL